MKLSRSIRWRLQVWHGVLLAGLLAGCALALYTLERNALLRRADEELGRLVFDLDQATRGRRPDRPPRPGDDRPPRGEPPPIRQELAPGDFFSERERARGFYYAIWLKNGAPFTVSAGAPADLARPDTRPGGLRLRTRGEYREVYHAPNPGDAFLVGRPLTEELAQLHRFAWMLAAGSVAIFAVALLIGWWLITRALQPVSDIGAAAEKIATGDLTQRIDTRDTESELGRLAGVLNSTFARLEAAFTQQARFTADAAHELRTPVAVMLTHAQNGLTAEGLTPEQREAFEACLRAAQRMRRLIESLLELARLDAGQEAMQRETVDLGAIAAHSLQSLRSLAEARKIALSPSISPAWCRGDAAWLEQVATNLIANAIQHNRDGGTVRTSTGRDADGAFLMVEDDGPGIGREHLPHVFERFYRAEQSRSTQSGRTGLGLAIAKTIVDAHGGSITVKSDPGRGAVLTVRLPAAE